MLFHLNLGSNIEPRQEHLRGALALIEKIPGVSVVGCSRIYATPAVDMTAPAGPFLNCCAAVRTSLRADRLLARLKEIELLMGRPAASKGACVSRTIDIDIVGTTSRHATTAAAPPRTPFVSARRRTPEAASEKASVRRRRLMSIPRPPARSSPVRADSRRSRMSWSW